MYSVNDDTGPLVHALLRTTPGKKLIGAKSWLSFRDFAKIRAQMLGKSIEFVDSGPTLNVGDPEREEDYAHMIGFCVDLAMMAGRSTRMFCSQRSWECKSSSSPWKSGVQSKNGSIRSLQTYMKSNDIFFCFAFFLRMLSLRVPSTSDLMSILPSIAR